MNNPQGKGSTCVGILNLDLSFESSREKQLSIIARVTRRDIVRCVFQTFIPALNVWGNKI